MTAHLRLFLIVCMLQATLSTSAAGDDAKGWFEDDCSGATFHIAKFAGASPGQYLVLRFSSGSPMPILLFEGTGWLDMQAKLCVSEDKCEPTTQSKIWLDKTKGTSRISGKYTANFNGQHLEGQFRVKYRRKNPPAICE